MAGLTFNVVPKGATWSWIGRPIDGDQGQANDLNSRVEIHMSLRVPDCERRRCCVAIYVKQGDAYSLPVEIRMNDEALRVADVETVEFYIGGLRKVYPGDVGYSEENGVFELPLTQQETFDWEADSTVELDIRIKYVNGIVQGIVPRKVNVIDAISTEVL